jgi:transposase-like protein
MNFFDFCQLIGSKEALIKYFQDNGLLKSEMSCNYCSRRMCIQSYTDSSDGFIFRCNNCKKRRSLRAGTFLERIKISLREFASILYLLNAEIHLKHIAEMLELSEKTIIDYAHLIREQYGKYLLDNGAKLGGTNIRVQVWIFFLNFRLMKVC